MGDRQEVKFCSVLFVVAALGFLLPPEALAQSRSTVEIEIGPGFAIGGGLEDPAPSLPTVCLGVAFWFAERWGIAVNDVRSYGEDLLEPPLRFLTGFLRGRRMCVIREPWLVIGRHSEMQATWSWALGSSLALPYFTP